MGIGVKDGSAWKSYREMEEERNSGEDERNDAVGDSGGGVHDDADKIRTDSISCFTSKLPPLNSYFPNESPRSDRGGAASSSAGDETGSETRDSALHSNSLVHVHIRDFESKGGVSNTYKQTGAALRRCKSLVLDPYWRLLKFISWLPIGVESFDSCRVCFFDFFNATYPVFVAALLFFTYSLEIVACIGNFDINNLNRTTFYDPFDGASGTENGGIYADYLNGVGVLASGLTRVNDSAPLSAKPAIIACSHVISTYVITDVLHFAAFCIGLYAERVLRTEQLYALMEKVFLVVSPIAGVPALKDAQKFLMRRLRIFMYCGIIWATLAAGLRLLFSLAYRGGPFQIDIWIYGRNMKVSQLVSGQAGAWTLAVLQYVGVIFYHFVNLAIVANYAASCELLRSLIHSLASQLQGKSISLNDAMKEISYIRSCVTSLNGTLSKMASLISVGNLEISIIGIVYLFRLDSNISVVIWVYRTIHVIIYVAVTLLPFYEAARLNATCLKFRSIALDARVFGYRDASLIDLDSFLNFVTTTKVEAKLMMVPIKHTILAAVLYGTSLTVLLLVQLSVITPANSYI